MPQKNIIPAHHAVAIFLDSIHHPTQKSDAWELLDIMHRITKEQPKIWEKTIVGFGKFHYQYKTKRHGEWFLVGLSPRKKHITVYFMCELMHLNLKKLGKIKKGVGCICFKSLADLDVEKSWEIISTAVQKVKDRKF
jgi:uncharacterized protein YdhG (YjbR/CyaY superfamily)